MNGNRCVVTIMYEG